jgi:hypothetical protein
MSLIELKYQKSIEELKLELQGFPSKFSVTLDLWTSKNNLSFQGITGHWLSDDWDKKSELLSLNRS